MSADSTKCSFTIEEIQIQKDDPRLKQFFELPEEEKQSSFEVIIHPCGVTQQY